MLMYMFHSTHQLEPPLMHILTPLSTLQLEPSLTPLLHATQVVKNMDSVSKSLAKAMSGMDLEKVTEIMGKFETQFEDLDVRTAVSIAPWCQVD